MKKYIISGMVMVVVLLIASLIPNALGGNNDKMDPTDGYEHTIGICFNPPTLDGVVNVGSSWLSSQYVGGAYIATDPNPAADVYMTIEMDGDNIEYLWIGVKTISPYTLKPTQGQWLEIDWDQDGKLDYVDHTGWTVTDGLDSNNAAEWMIPWGKIRVLPNDEPEYMDSTKDISNSIDIFIHVETYKFGVYNTATFPGRPDAGKFLSTSINIDLTPPDDEDDFGIRSMGFWKHQLRTALGEPGHQHVATDDLFDYLDYMDENTELTELQGLKLRDALMLLEDLDHSDMYHKAVQQLLATWLNYASDGDQMVDTDGDDATDMMLSAAIEKVEDILNDPNATKADIEEAKDICECINTSG